MSGITLERGRRFGDVWLGWTLWRALKLDERVSDLFGAQYDLPLYDITSTYFEGLARGNRLAKRGHSRDHRPDCKQVCIALIEKKHGKLNRIWVLDRGLASEKNVAFPRKGKRQYVVATPKAMHNRFEKRIARGLASLERRLQRARKRIPRANVAGMTPAQFWKTYVQLTEAENAFRMHKSDLRLRPIWHHKTKRVEAHILVCFLAYALYKTLEQWSHRAGLGKSPKTLLEEMARIQTADVVLPTTDGRELRIRCVVQPDRAQAILLQQLGLELPRRLKIPAVG